MSFHRREETNPRRLLFCLPLLNRFAATREGGCVASGEESETPFLDPHAYMASGYSLAISAQPEWSRGIWFEFVKLIKSRCA